jgi:hypothetical protein
MTNKLHIKYLNFHIILNLKSEYTKTPATIPPKFFLDGSISE